MPENIPDKIYNAAVKDGVYFDQYSASLNKRVQSLLQGTQDEIVAAIAKNDPTAPTMTKYKTARLEKLNEEISAILDSGYGNINKHIDSQLKKMGGLQAKNVVDSFNGSVGADLFDINLTPSGVKAIVENTMIQGNTIGKWWEKQSADTKAKLSASMAAGTQAIQIGLVQGETVGDLINRVRGTKTTPGVMSVTKREATALVRTSVSQVSNAVRLETYKANVDVLDGFEVVATLDDRTTELCRALDGKRWTFDLVPIGHGFPYPGGPPFHFNCFIDGQTPIYTSKGWVAIRNIKTGDFVLTHKGRFRNVTEIIRTPLQTPNVVKFALKGRGSHLPISVTSGHPILTDKGWISAGELKSGDKVVLLSHKCKRVDGSYWHKDKEKDNIRQKNIEGEGWQVFRFGEDQINKNFGCVEKEVLRIASNHKELYQFSEYEICVINKWRLKKARTLYNFSVEEDESYIARGFVVHNCRSTTIPITKSWAALAGPKSQLPPSKIKELDNIPAGERASMNGPVPSNLTYNDWLKTQSVEFQKSVLGPGKWKMWSENKLDMMDLIDNSGNPLTLKQLAANLGDILAKKEVALEALMVTAAAEAGALPAFSQQIELMKNADPTVGKILQEKGGITQFYKDAVQSIEAEKAARAEARLLKTINDPEKVAKFVPGQSLPPGLYNPIEGAFAGAKGGGANYGKLEFKYGDFFQPALKETQGLKNSSGMIIVDEATGKIWINSPTNQFGGYKNTFPKGTWDKVYAPGPIDLQTTAIKEVFEETGLQARPIYHLGDYQKTTSTTRYYVGVKTGGSPTMMGWESEAVNLVPTNQLTDLLNTAIDKKIAQDFIEQYTKALELGKGDFKIGFRLLDQDKIAVPLKEKLLASNTTLADIAKKKLAAVPNLVELGENAQYQYLKYEMDNAAADQIAVWQSEIGTIGSKAYNQTKFIDDPIAYYSKLSEQVKILQTQADSDLIALTSTADGGQAFVNAFKRGSITNATDPLVKIKAVQAEKEALFTKFDFFIDLIKPGSAESIAMNDIPSIPGNVKGAVFKALGSEGKIKAIQEEANLINSNAKIYLETEKKVAPNVFSAMQKQVSNWDDLTPWEQRAYYDGDLGKQIKFSLQEIDKLLKMPEGQTVWAEANQKILSTWKPQDVKSWLEDQIMKQPTQDSWESYLAGIKPGSAEAVAHAELKKLSGFGYWQGEDKAAAVMEKAKELEKIAKEKIANLLSGSQKGTAIFNELGNQVPGWGEMGAYEKLAMFVPNKKGSLAKQIATALTEKKNILATSDGKAVKQLAEHLKFDLEVMKVQDQVKWLQESIETYKKKTGIPGQPGSISGKLVADLTVKQKDILNILDGYMKTPAWEWIDSGPAFKKQSTELWNMLDSSVKQSLMKGWANVGVSPPPAWMGPTEKRLWQAVTDLPKNDGVLNGKLWSDLDLIEQKKMTDLSDLIKTPPWKGFTGDEEKKYQWELASSTWKSKATKVWQSLDTSLKKPFLEEWVAAKARIPAELLSPSDIKMVEEIKAGSTAGKAVSKYEITTLSQLERLPDHSINTMDDFYALKIDPDVIQVYPYAISDKFTMSLTDIATSEKNAMGISWPEYFSGKFGVRQPVGLDAQAETHALEFLDDGIKKGWLDLNQIDLQSTTGYTKEELVYIWEKQPASTKAKYFEEWAGKQMSKVPAEFQFGYAEKTVEQKALSQLSAKGYSEFTTTKAASASVDDLLGQMGLNATEKAVPEYIPPPLKQGALTGTVEMGKTAYNLDLPEDLAKFKSNQSALVGEYTKNLAKGKAASKGQMDAYNFLTEEAQAKIDKKIAQLSGVDIKPVSPVVEKAPASLDFNSMTKYSGQEGSNTGGFYRNINNPAERYYIKMPGNEETVRNEVLAGKLYKAAGVEVPELQIINANGEKAVASRIIDGIEKNSELLKSGALRAGIYDDFVVDAWLGDWDVVGMSYDNLQIKDGIRAVRVDVGGSLRFRAQGGAKGGQFSDKVLELSSMRDGRTNPKAAAVFKKIKQSELDAGARKVLSVSDSQIRELVNEFGPLNQVERDRLAETLIARKKYIQEQFPHIKVEEAIAKAPKDLENAVSDFEHQAIETSRINGYVIKVDKEAIEDHQFLVWYEKDVTGKPVTAVQFKLRGQGAEKMNAIADASSFEKAHFYNTNELHSSILDSFRGIAMQSRGGEALRAKDIERAKTTLDAFAKEINSLKANPLFSNADVDAMAKHYKPWLERLKEVITTGEGRKYKMPDDTTFKEALTKFRNIKAIPPKVTKIETGIAFTKSDGAMYVKTNIKGFAQQKNEVIRALKDKYLEAEIDGVKVKYWPNTDDIWFSHRGLVRAETSGNQTIDIERIMSVLQDRLKVDLTRATAAEDELMYLKQIAYARNDNFGRALISNVSSYESAEKQIEYLQRELSKKAGYDITKVSEYKPEGIATAFDVGKVNRYRPDLNGPEWEDFKEKYRIRHQLWSGTDYDVMIEKVVNNGGDLTATVDKFRKGFDWSRTSPESDMATGGGNSVFTRIVSQTKSNEGYGLVWRSDVMARVDALSYNRDVFGECGEDFIKSNRKTTIDDWVGNAKRGRNETNFKQSLSIFDKNFEKMVVPRDQVQKIIQFFKDNKYYQWPDGRRLEDVIVGK